jgi:hypothetical protein
MREKHLNRDVREVQGSKKYKDLRSSLMQFLKSRTILEKFRE